MRAPAFLLSLLLLISTMQASHAAVLQICPADGPPAQVEAALTGADGAPRRIVATEALQPGCSGVALPVALADVLALLPVPQPAAGKAGNVGDTLILHAPGVAGKFQVASIEVPAPEGKAGTGAFPLARNLLPLLQSRPFGIEERVELVHGDESLLLRCTPGSRPAGVVLSGPWFLTRSRAALHWSARGDAAVSLAISDAPAALRETGVVLGPIKDGQGQLPLPRSGLDPARWRHFTLTCPAQGGTLELSDLRLVAQADTPPPRAAWVWSPDAWRDDPARVLRHAHDHGIRTVFVSIPVRQGAVDAPEALADFVRQAREAGVTVWSVDGDPAMVLPGQAAAAVARVRAYANYNRGADRSARLAGMQFDVEHYLVPGYGAAADSLDRRYATLAGALRKAAGALPLDFVVPFWWTGKPRLMAALEKSASSITVMDYRTDAGQIAAFAQPFLDWGALHGKAVRIALEAGPLAAERQRRYRRVAKGDVWIVDVEGQAVLVMLRTPQANPAGPAYSMVYERVLDGSATTFHGREQDLMALLPGLERDFSAWESFAGIALHELR